MKLLLFILAFIFTFQCSKKDDQAVDYIANDIWVLEEINGVENSIEGQMGKPSLEIHLSDSTYLGYTGCNNFNGKFVLKEQNIKFLPAATTRKYCNDKGLEQAFFTALQQTTNFKVKEMKLQLFKEDLLTASFKKVD